MGKFVLKKDEQSFIWHGKTHSGRSYEHGLVYSTEEIPNSVIGKFIELGGNDEVILSSPVITDEPTDQSSPMDDGIVTVDEID